MKDYAFLLDRPERTFPDDEINRYFGGRRVLVTGAGGTIGSAVCKRLIGVAKFVGALGHSELPLFNLSPDIDPSCGAMRLADVTRPGLDTVFKDWKPDVVIHAAAHKHVGMLEGQPAQALINNVIGTINVAETSMRNGVEKFVFISTDKAACPTSVMGKSKRLAELWLLAKYKAAGIVRFGNVIGSSGSLVEIIEKKFAAGEAVTLTDPRMERWFITAREAVGLVLSATISVPGIFTLDMGEPVNICSIVNRLLVAAGGRGEVIFSAPGTGEKLSEHLTNPGEELVRWPGSAMFEIKHPAVTERDFEDFRREHFEG